MTASINDLENATPENWKELYKNANEEDIYTLAYRYDSGQTINLVSGLRAKHELRCRENKTQRGGVWIERIITILAAFGAIALERMVGK